MPTTMAQLNAGDQEVVGSTPSGSATFFHVDLLIKLFSSVILSLLLIQEGQFQFLAKESARYWLTAYWTKPVQ